MKPFTDISELIDGHRLHALRGSKKDRYRFRSAAKVSLVGFMIDTCAISMLIPNCRRIGSRNRRYGGNSDHRSPWTGGVDPKSRASLQLWYTATQFNGLRPV